VTTRLAAMLLALSVAALMAGRVPRRMTVSRNRTTDWDDWGEPER